MKGLKLALARSLSDFMQYIILVKMTSQQMMETAKISLQADDSIVLKGSNGMGLLEVVEFLQA